MAVWIINVCSVLLSPVFDPLEWAESMDGQMPGMDEAMLMQASDGVMETTVLVLKLFVMAHAAHIVKTASCLTRMLR